MSRGIIYIMWNELFPNLVKIGRTGGSTPQDVEKRRQRLSNKTNLPQPFEVKFAICINNYDKVEPLIHQALAKLRPNPHREFFTLSVEEAICLLRTYTVSSDAKEIVVKDSLLPIEKKAIRNVRTKRKKITFKSLGVPIDSILTFIGNPKLKVKTLNDSRRVIMLDTGKKTTISIAASQYRKKTNPNNTVKGLPDGITDFLYEGKTLIELALKKKLIV